MAAELTDKMQRVLVAMLDARERSAGAGYPKSEAVTGNAVGRALNLPSARRRRGPWSGYMGPAQRVIAPMNALCRRGLIRLGERPDGLSGTAYSLTFAGAVKARELREAGVRADGEAL